jgi:aspartate carbamoyltransferase regulatory subunit
MNSQQHLLIPKIESGIVIDHVPAGLGPAILEMLRSYPGMESIQITLGLNYESSKLGRKDMLKLIVPELPQKLLAHLSLVASGVTIKRVADYSVAGKYSLAPPDTIEAMANCINPNCISNNERQVIPKFVRLHPDSWKFRCNYCERVFELGELDVVLP